MKNFDAVKIMRDIRTRLSERYQKDVRRQIEDLQQIHEKYNIHSPSRLVKKSKVAEDKANYGSPDS